MITMPSEDFAREAAFTQLLAQKDVVLNNYTVFWSNLTASIENRIQLAGKFMSSAVTATPLHIMNKFFG